MHQSRTANLLTISESVKMSLAKGIKMSINENGKLFVASIALSFNSARRILTSTGDSRTKSSILFDPDTCFEIRRCFLNAGGVLSHFCVRLQSYYKFCKMLVHDYL